MSFQGHDLDGMLDASNVPDILLHDGRFLSNARLKTETISILSIPWCPCNRPSIMKSCMTLAFRPLEDCKASHLQKRGRKVCDKLRPTLLWSRLDFCSSLLESASSSLLSGSQADFSDGSGGAVLSEREW